MQEQRKYRAFISYRHTSPDKPVAIVLQQQLEHYRVPGYLQKQGYPAQLGFIFRDEADLPTSSDLGNQIQSALDNSEYLIVICSPNAPHSKYVAAEIEYFKSKRGDNHCLALIVEGDPSTQKIFPDELTKRYDFNENNLAFIEPIAADVRADTLKASLKKLKLSKLKIVAGLLGCNYDDLVRRQRERRLKRIAAFSMAAAVFFICFGLFLLRQLSIVNESQRKTQLAYSEQSLMSGNHVLAMEQAIAAMKKNNTLFSKNISPDTMDSLFKASLIPAFSSYTQIPLTSQLENGTFTLDGKQILVKSDYGVKGYDLQGKFLWDFTVEGKGDRIVAVSPDGSRAAVVKSNIKEKLPTKLTLWDTKKNICLAQLLDSSNYSVHDVLQMDFSNVLQADFSPDGQYVCAYRMGGYFNENKKIQFWDTSTGTVKKSFDAALLGTRQDGGQGSIVLESRYYKNGMICLKGSTNYVYYNPDWEKPVAVPLREHSASDYISVSSDGRFGVYIDESGQYHMKDRSSQRTVLFMQKKGNSIAADQIKYVDQRYAVIPILSEEKNIKHYTGVEVIDLGIMEMCGSFEFSEVSYNQFKELSLLTEENSDQVYIIGMDGFRKLGKTTFGENNTTLLMLALSRNNLCQLAENLDYLNEGIWKTTRLSGSSKDFLVSQQTDETGNMKVLELDPGTGEIRNLYHLPKGGEFSAQGAQINANASCLLSRESTSLFIYSLLNQPGAEVQERCEIFAEGSGSDRLVTFDAGVLKLWGKNEMRKQLTLKERVLDLYLSNNGSVLIGISADNEIISWNAEDLTERCRIALKQEEYHQFRISSDGKRIAAIVGETLDLYDSETGKLIKTLSDQASTPEPLGAWSEKMAFSPDGSLIACITKYYPEGQNQYTRVVRLWHAETGEDAGLIPTTYVDKRDMLTYTAEKADDLPLSMDSIFFSKEGMKICTILSNTVSIWDLEAKKKVSAIQEEGVPQNAPCIDEKEKLLVYAVKGVVHIWNLESNQREKSFALEEGILDFAISPEKRWLLGSSPEGAWLFDLQTGECAGKVLNEAALFAQWTNKGEGLSYYSIENSQLRIVPYLYNNPVKIGQEWLNNRK